MTRLHISAICGTFMGGIAQIAKQMGFQVTGSDRHCYPPMSDQLIQAGIELQEGFSADNVANYPDKVIIGNALSRGNPEVEAVLNLGLNYQSGPQWLGEQVLKDKWVVSIAGTHGKTTTASMVAWILEVNGFNPGFLIGGVPDNFGVSARVTDSPFFVVEADEYDTAFFDKRSKFVHYYSKTAVLNNLEFDHADIFDNLSAIETQFHHLVRTIPGQGLIIRPQDSKAIDRVIEKGCWTPVQTTHSHASEIEEQQSADWYAEKLNKDASQFNLFYQGKRQGLVEWRLIGDHNMQNALSAIAAAHHCGVKIPDALSALSSFKGVKRRMELKADIQGVRIYDDFAHHPTAIALSVDGLRHHLSTNETLVAVVDVRSNTMKMGHHKETLIPALAKADQIFIHDPQGIDWSNTNDKVSITQDVSTLEKQLLDIAKPGTHLLLMSNGAFGHIYQHLTEALKKRFDN